MPRVKVSECLCLLSRPGLSMMPSTADSPHGGLREAQLRGSSTRLDMPGLIGPNAKFYDTSALV